MSDSIDARIVGFQSADFLRVEWLSRESEGGVPIGGPVANDIPVALVPKELQVPNTVVRITLRSHCATAFRLRCSDSARDVMKRSPIRFANPPAA